MVKRFKALCISALLTLCCTSAYGDITRTDDGGRASTPAASHRGVMLPARVLAKLTRVTQKQQASVLPQLSSDRKVPRRAASVKANLPAKGTAKVTDLQGYCTYTGSTESAGWYAIPSSLSASLKWEKSTDFTPRTGFVRGDEVFAFYTYATTSGMTDAGYYVLDLATGKMKDNVAFSIFDTLEEVVVAAAYDAESDVAYVITLSADGNNFQLQQFNPATRKFINLGVSAPSDWLELGWNPADKSLYMFDESGSLRKYDAKGKKFNYSNAFSFDIDTYTQSMVYSPNDNAFILPVDVYDETDGEFTGLFMLPVSGTPTYLGAFATGPQYAILYTPDKYVNANGPKAPVLKSWNLKGDATEGNFVITLPSKFENGNPISGKVYVRVNIDNVDMTGSYSGNAGADLTIAVNLTEGLHRFIITPYTLSDDGKMNGTPLVFDRAVGADVPKAPEKVTLTKNKVSWSAVTEGANGGSIDVASVTYNVYIDGVLMNAAPVTATSLDVTMPASGKVAHVAEVFALCDGKTSEAGVSNKLYEDGALSLPVFLGPEEGASDMEDEVIAMFTPVKDMLNTEDLRGWRYDDQSEHTGGFYCLAPKASSLGNTSNEWLFLPAINFTDKDAHYKLTMDVWSGNHYFTSDETYEIALCQRPSPSRPVVIREASTIFKNPHFETSETLFQVPEEGEWYIGIHYISPIGSYRLYARNFRVEVAQSSADSPATVTSLTAEAAERGVLTATLSFTMPTVSISGATLDAATVITATAVSDGGSASVTGHPGEKVSLVVPTVQGDNKIGVTTSSDKGQGQLAEVTVYCGIYRPATPIVFTSVSDDNTTLTLDFELDDYNDNGEYTGPDLTDVLVYRQVNGEWRVAADLGKNRTWEFTAASDKQEMYSFAVASKNEVGYCEEMYSFLVHLGKLYNVPMVETFPMEGDYLKPNYEPISIEHLSYLQSAWGVINPRDLDEMAGNESGNALCAIYDGESQLILPRFTTVGHNNVKLDLSLFFGNNTPDLISVYATTPSLEMEPVATITPESGNGWQHKLISLPSICQNAAWVQLIIRVKIVGYSQTFMMDSYSVKDYPADMMTISSFAGPTRSQIGKTLTYNVEIENAGCADATFPAYTFAVSGVNGAIPFTLTSEVPATIAAGKKAALSFAVTPKAAHKGNATVSFKLEGQPAEATASVEQNLEILNAPVPVVSDLAAAADGNNVTLTWSEPKFAENFEACETWEMSDEIAGFKNIDLDGGKLWGIEEVNFPGKGAPKAFQVFTSESTDNPLFAAHSGSQYLLCMSASKVASDDWLISPEIVGGSEMSFWMNLLSADYPETVLVMYSTTGNNPEDFTEMVDNGYVCPDETGWTEFGFTLPADARYFALNHVAEEADAAFGFMIDDITFEAANPVATLDGYNLYRDNDAVASNLTKPNFTDTGVDLSEPVRYYVHSVGTVNGEKIESDRSNVVWVEDSGVEDVAIDSDKSISATDSAIILQGFAAGERFTVTNAAGMTITAGVTADVTTVIPASTGIYIVKCGNIVAKVIVK